MNDEYFMKEAIKQAKIAAEEGEVTVGAVVVYNCEIILLEKAFEQINHLLKVSNISNLYIESNKTLLSRIIIL